MATVCDDFQFMFSLSLYHTTLLPFSSSYRSRKLFILILENESKYNDLILSEFSLLYLLVAAPIVNEHQEYIVYLYFL